LGTAWDLTFLHIVFASETLNSRGFFLWIARIDESNFWTSPQFFRQSDATATDSVFFSTDIHRIHQVLGGASDFGGERWDDPIVKPAMVASGGQIVWDPNPPRPSASQKTIGLVDLWWIYGGFIVDLPIENDDFMGFWYGILVWVTMGYPLVMTFTGLAMVKPWPCHRNRWAIPFLDVLSMVVIFHGELLVITRWYIKKETSKIFTRTL